jgi:hypothetical protein
MTVVVKHERKYSVKRFQLEEDIKLKQLIFQFGTSNWKLIEKQMINRSARQCKERWTNYISPFVKQSEWSIEEETQLIQLFEIYSSRWTKIAEYFNNRTPLHCKNHILTLQNQKKKFELKKTNQSTKNESKNNETFSPKSEIDSLELFHIDEENIGDSFSNVINSFFE